MTLKRLEDRAKRAKETGENKEEVVSRIAGRCLEIVVQVSSVRGQVAAVGV